jgi:hypothetical protein
MIVCECLLWGKSHRVAAYPESMVAKGSQILIRVVALDHRLVGGLVDFSILESGGDEHTRLALDAAMMAFVSRQCRAA